MCTHSNEWGIVKTSTIEIITQPTILSLKTVGAKMSEIVLEGKSDKWLSENSTNTNLTIIECKRIRYKIRYKYISDEYF